jgi:hypothetical protein
VRTENMVHTLEHGAVWLTYDPGQVTGDALAALTKKVKGQPYTVMSPYPGLDKPLSLQSWGHRLKLTDPADPPRRPVHQIVARERLHVPGTGRHVRALRVLRSGQPATIRPQPCSGGVPTGRQLTVSRHLVLTLSSGRDPEQWWVKK